MRVGTRLPEPRDRSDADPRGDRRQRVVIQSTLGQITAWEILQHRVGRRRRRLERSAGVGEAASELEVRYFDEEAAIAQVEIVEQVFRGAHRRPGQPAALASRVHLGGGMAGAEPLDDIEHVLGLALEDGRIEA